LLLQEALNIGIDGARAGIALRIEILARGGGKRGRLVAVKKESLLALAGVTAHLDGLCRIIIVKKSLEITGALAQVGRHGRRPIIITEILDQILGRCDVLGLTVRRYRVLVEDREQIRDVIWRNAVTGHRDIVKNRKHGAHRIGGIRIGLIR